MQIVGPVTNVAFLAALAGHPAFATGEIDTGFIRPPPPRPIVEPGPVPPRLLALACLDILLRREDEARAQARQSADPNSPWHRTDGWRLNDDNHHVLSFRDAKHLSRRSSTTKTAAFCSICPTTALRSLRGERDSAGDLLADDDARLCASVIRAGEAITVISGGDGHTLTIEDPAARAELSEPATGSLRAPMPGRVVAVNVDPGTMLAGEDPRRTRSHEDGARHHRAGPPHRRQRSLRARRSGRGRRRTGGLRR